MRIFEILYTITIYPLEYIISLLFFYFYDINKSSPFVSLFFLSIAVNILSLPLYNMAEKWQEKERALQSFLKPKIDNIKSCFKGDKKYMLIRACHRVYGYKTIYAFRGTLGLLIQIPFFLAAYNFLSNYTGFNGFSVFAIKDISKPDALLSIGSVSINVLPFVMTILNIFSAFVYSKKLTLKEKLPLFFMSLLFLVLLYNSPATLVFYWSVNCAFSLFKNIIYPNTYKIKEFFRNDNFIYIFNKVLKVVLIVQLVAMSIMSVLYSLREKIILMSKENPKFLALKIHPKTYSDLLAVFMLLLIIFIYMNREKILKNRFIKYFSFDNSYDENNNNFILMFPSLLVMTMLSGLFIPSSLISSSPQEFQSPFSLIANSFFMYLGLFILYPICLYFLFSDNFKKKCDFIFPIFSIIAIVNVFIMTGNYGLIEPDISFANPKVLIASGKDILISLSLFVLSILLVLVLFKYKKTSLLSNIFAITSLALIITTFINFDKIYKEHKTLEKTKAYNDSVYEKKIFNFSKTGTNVLIIMLDKCSAYYTEKVFEKAPELKEKFRGFNFYMNNVSLGETTIASTPSVFGGYEYSPYEISMKTNQYLVDIHTEALLVLPKLFSSKNYKVTFFEPPFAGFSWFSDISVFKNHKDINFQVRNYKEIDEMMDIIDPLSKEEKIEELKKDSIKEFYAKEKKLETLKKRISMFSTFRILPIFYRSLLYSFYSNRKLFVEDFGIIGKGGSMVYYAILKSFIEKINITNNINTLNIFVNDAVHDPLQFNQNYLPSRIAKPIPKKDSDEFGDEFLTRTFYATMASMEELGNIFDYLRKNDVYDNTKIIIVSDHAFDLSKFGFDFSNSRYNEIQSLVVFHSLLLVKDFSSTNEMSIETNFMTTGDVAYLATKHLDNPINPFTGNAITNMNKDNGIKAVRYSWYWFEDKFNKPYSGPSENYYIVKDNIFISNNWQKIETTNK